MRQYNFKDGYKMTTEEAYELIDMLKEKVSQANIDFPTLGKKIEFDVFAKEDGTKFIVNINRSSIDKRKCTYQGRTYINSIPLLRLDVTNSFHRNPDGNKIQGTHLHIYNEKNELSEAIPFNINSDDLYEYCIEFFKKFNIIANTCNIIYQTEI